jgi:selenium metabolism protein YedF
LEKIPPALNIFSLVHLQLNISGMKSVDARGQLCPAPIIALKKALKQVMEGESFELLTDNKVSLNNISRFLDDNNIPYTVSEKGEIWSVIITKGNRNTLQLKPEFSTRDMVPHFSKGNFVIAFSSDIMGDGDRILGQILIENFIKSVKDLDILPGKIVFYNRGVYLGSESSPMVGHISDLEKMGVEIFLCSTCIDHYSLSQKIKVGKLSNMYEIVQIMASAGNVIKP